MLTAMPCKDWEIIYEDYSAPEEAKQWFGLRTDLLFNLLKPPSEVIKQLDSHFLAFLIPYKCDCRQGITPQWHSRFARKYVLTCGYCKRKRTVNREDFTTISIPPP